MDRYYETLGMIYESCDNGYITEETKNKLIEKLKAAKAKVAEKIKNVDKKKILKGAAIGAGIAAAGAAGAIANKKANEKFDKDIDRAKNDAKAFDSVANDENLRKATRDKARVRADEAIAKLAKYGDLDVERDTFRGVKAKLRK